MKIALDPGHPETYGAVFCNGVCTHLAIFSRANAQAYRNHFEEAWIEKPSMQNVPNIQHMAEVRWTGALVASALSRSVLDFDPMTWKGGIKKPIHHGRVWEYMLPQERALFPANTFGVISKSRTKLAETGKVVGYSHAWHNHLDALALGMFALGRIKRGGIKGTVNV